MATADWLTIRNDYINGGGSYRSLAKKYGVSSSTIQIKGRKEKWVEQREEQQRMNNAKILQKTQEKISEAVSEQMAAKARIATKLTVMVEHWLDDHVDHEDAGDIRRMVQCGVDMGIFAANEDSGEQAAQIDTHNALIQAIKERNGED